MITRYLLTGVAFMLPFSTITAENIIEQLYTENCIACHSQMTAGNGEVLYTRKNRLGTNKEELVQILSTHHQDLNLGWDQDTLDNLYEYLNTRYYQFGQ